LSDTDENSNTDFPEHDNDALLIDVGDDSDMGDSACVTDTNFLWEDMDNYIRHQEIFPGISEPQDSAKDVTNIIDI
jgi:hypothetical protein